MIAVQEAIAQLEVLLNEFATLASKSRETDMSDLGIERRVLEARIQAAIERFSSPGSVYARDAAQADKRYSKIHELAGIATALRDDLKAGWLESVVELVHADTYSDFLEMIMALMRDSAKLRLSDFLRIQWYLCGRRR